MCKIIWMCCAVLLPIGLIQVRAEEKAPPVASSAAAETKKEQTEHPTWAQKIEPTQLLNFHRVTPDLYRGAQPTADGVRELKERGIKLMVNLRLTKSDRSAANTWGVKYEHIYFNPWHPEEEDVIKFLKLVTKPEHQPAFVHCTHGADRTGTMCAAYRICVQNWTKDDALQEMREGGFNFHEDYFQNLLNFLRKLDVDKVKKEAGIK